MRFIICYILLLTTYNLTAQTNDEGYKTLAGLILNKINQLRNEHHLPTLENRDELSNAANFHSVYMARYDRLKHEELAKKTKTPYKRVQKYSNEYEMVGENILFITHKSDKIKEKDLESIASEMFNIWKDSPEHYENMVNPQYKFCGFGFVIGKNKLYATNVFGTKGYIVDGQQSQNAFGIKPYNNSCKEFLERKNNLITNLGNSIDIEGDKAVLRIHNKQLIDEIFTNEKDGIAIDIITREQFENKETNLLDFSPVYDGLMLQPIYRDEIKQSNISQGDFRYTGEIGIIPESFYGKEINANLIFIKDDVSCDYKYPAYIPSEDYNLFPIEPKIVNPQHPPFLKKGISTCYTISFGFDRNKTIPADDVDPMDFNGSIKYIEITSYSSVEGDSVRNVQLQKQRAEYIRNFISQKLNTSDLSYKITTKENWPLMRFQLKIMGMDSLAYSSKEKIKQFLIDDQQHNWDSLLFLQRKSYATLYYENNFNPADSDFYNQNYHSGMFYSNANLANRSLAAIYNMDCLDYFSFMPSEKDSILSNPLLVQNTAAILTKIYYYDFEHSVQFLDYWLNNLDLLNKDTKYNLCILYCEIVADILDSWDVNKKTFSKIIPPERIINHISEFSEYPDYNQLLLNYHITASRYYGQNNDYPNLVKSFNFITNYFRNISLDIKDEIKLCLFFNSWSRYDLCINFLKKRMNDKDFNEDAAFLLARTGTAYPYILTEEELNAIIKRAFITNKEKWCNWINEEFQHQRNKTIKKIYCEECSEK